MCCETEKYLKRLPNIIPEIPLHDVNLQEDILGQKGRLPAVLIPITEGSRILMHAQVLYQFHGAANMEPIKTFPDLQDANFELLQLHFVSTFRPSWMRLKSA
jgi:hypothetical protein